ncbi:MAG: aspartate--tRNA ligase, partial [Pseudomonadota bacterium]
MSETLLRKGRSHTCGELRAEDAGKDVVLVGWVHSQRDLGGTIFLVVRDRYGLTQVVFRPDANKELHEKAKELRPEFCIGVAGRAVSRGKDINPNMSTGAIEIIASELQVFSPSETPPFLIEETIDTRENLRLEYRYLDLRRPSMQKNFFLRAKANSVFRSFLDAQSFLELETPYLIKNTPGGARNFLVPSRLTPRSFYALAESPQLFKQLFMVAGFDRYYQIVRCFRDEDLRGDRQPEFTQVDIEASFIEETHMYSLIEGLMTTLFKEVLGISITTPFAKLTYKEALDKYGTDKPDLR